MAGEGQSGGGALTKRPGASGKSPAAGAVRKGPAAGRRPTSAGARNANRGGILNFYTDEAPGLKIGPTTVLVLSLLFIAFVVLLHIWGKFRN